MAPTVSIVIPTHERRDDLIATLTALSRLDPPAEEIIVWLDGCSGDTAAALGAFAHVTVAGGHPRAGSIPARDTAFRMARGDIIVSLDDDSYPASPDFVAQVKDLAGKHPEAGAFAFREVRDTGPRPSLCRTATPQKAYVATYANCAGAIRRRLYGTLTAYPRFFSHAYAEADFCLQMYAAGYGVLFTPDIEIMHRFTDTKRNMKARHSRNARNEFWSVVMRCPFPQVMGVAAYRMARQAIYGTSQGWGWLKDEPRWIVEALAGLRAPLSARKPLPWNIYWRWMRLARSPIPAHRDALFVAFPHMVGGQEPHFVDAATVGPPRR